MIRLVVISVMLVGACCGSPSRPLFPPGQVAVSGEFTFRTRSGNAIDVSVEREFLGRAVAGAVTLRDMPLEVAQQSPLVRVAAARAWLTLVDQLADEPAAAYEAARRGVDELGTEYRNSRRGGTHVIDDTGMAIRLAEMAADRGDWQVAARELSKVLRTRVRSYLRVYRGAVE